MPSSSSDIITPIQILRSSDLSKRPIPNVAPFNLPGQPAVNTNADDPGLYFADDSGGLLKIGPCHVGDDAPNSSFHINGLPGNCIGETWLDTSNPAFPVFKVWDGTSWRSSGYVISNTLWVDSNGNDLNSGTSPLEPKKTIKSAISEASDGYTIFVSPGVYEEENPITFPDVNISLIAQTEGNTSIIPANDTHIFHLKGGNIVQGFTFVGELSASPLKSIFSFPPTGAGAVNQPPVIKNCINEIPNSIFVQSDGSLAADNPTIKVEGGLSNGINGVGLSSLNKGFIEANNFETIFSDVSIKAEMGGVIRASNCKSVYGDVALLSNGISAIEQIGDFSSLDTSGTVIGVINLEEPLRPYEGQVLTVGDTYYRVCGFNILDEGDGYTSVPSVEVSLGSGPNPLAAQGTAIIDDEKLIGIELTFPGQGYKEDDVITVTITGGGSSCPADAEVILAPIYYSVLNASEVVSNASVIQISSPLPYTPSPGDKVRLYRVSKIVAMSHYMGFVGSGNLSPYEGGAPISSNQIVQQSGGQIYCISSDQSGRFRVGNDFCVDQMTHSISGFAFHNSVLATVIPYTLGLK